MWKGAAAQLRRLPFAPTNSNDNLTSAVDALGNETTYTYWSADDEGAPNGNTHLLKSVTSAEGVVSSYVYNSRGQVTQTTLGDSTNYITSSSAYDSASGLLVSSTDARGSTVEYEYDSTTRQTLSVTDPKGTETTYSYGNAANMLRLNSVSQGGLSPVSYTYDQYGKLQTISRGGTTYTLTYDQWNRSLGTHVGSAETTPLARNEYDEYSRLSKVIYGNGFEVRYVYDSLDRVSQVYHKASASAAEVLMYEYVYNNDGDIYELRNYDTGRSSFFEYDHGGRCMRGTEREFVVSGSDVQFTTEVSSYRYKYDANNNLTQLLNTVDGNEWTTTYTYDGDNRPDTVTLNNGVIIDDSYDSLSRVTQRSIGVTTPFTTAYSYLPGADGSQTALVSQIDAGSLGTYTYTYDANGNIQTIGHYHYTTTYHYDSANQLIREDNQEKSYTSTYAYDSAGNITRQSNYSYVAPDTEVSSDKLTGYIDFIYSTGDWKDQIVQVVEYISSGGVIRPIFSRPVYYDASGNITTYKYNTLTWEGRQLKSYGAYTYEYDENGLRTSKTVSGVTTDYYYNGSLLMGLKRGSDTLLFSYDASGNVVSVNFNGTEYYYLKNAQSDVIGILDSSGIVAASYYYDAWGNPFTTTGTLASTLGAYNPFRYRSYVYDTETGFYYLQSRYYDPSYGRFISPEPNVYVGGFDSGAGVNGYNTYTYCSNNPINYSDPTGEFILTALIIGVVAGAVIGGTAGGIVAYNSAKSSGLEGSDLFWATAAGVGKGALIGGVFGGIAGGTGGVLAAYELTSIAATATITATATIGAKAVEVTGLQIRKSIGDGDNGWQVANDCMDSIFGNGGKILSPALTKACTTTATYLARDFVKHKVVPLGFNEFLKSTGGKILPYGLTLYAWGHTTYSWLCSDPIERADQRGYELN